MALPDTAADAQAAKRAADQAKQIKEARRLLRLLLAQLADRELDVKLDLDILAWLRAEAEGR